MRLSITEESVRAALKLLEDLDLIVRSGSFWVCKQKTLHLQKTSPVSALNHWLWRAKAFEKIPTLSAETFNYSGIYSISFQDKVKFRQIMTDFVTSIVERVEPSPAETIVGFNLDFFEL